MALHLLTGAGSGIGAALAARLQARGDDLILLARSDARAAELRERFPGAQTIVADLAAPGELAAALTRHDLPGRLDSLLHVAGVVDLGQVAELTVAKWASQLDVNLVAPAELTRLLLPALRAAKGQVVFVNSGAGLRAAPDWAAYAASKHGLKALADSLRAEESPHGVRVSSVYPGRTATAMQERVHEQEGRDYDPAGFIDADSVVTSILTVLDLPRDAQIPDLTIRPGV
ncbi:SDR family oxidoreductase [Microbacterium sp. zg.Y1090]|uniref:SDR family oxidoreductase n=1 Tax=Microbacterium wangruii TaxID=3049073 RepID=UPI00214ACD81|nr:MULTISPECIES: SDR family oxidoreductase [unclassified Microbacterium]MCR2818428.1 SDR family oxidoreductase [Microbacterium sp. zg.Y1090]MDL5486241.1 SDR family oxidoreductase [Microbacterium sp. zg-Y1211]WIM29439.1 SDR family oxidoreductase [Microbacterium sp. zg-Y1090]